jgi:hypothetical protein
MDLDVERLKSRRELNCWRTAGRNRKGDLKRNGSVAGPNLQPNRFEHDGNGRGLRGNCCTRRGAKLAERGAAVGGAQVCAAVELTREKD